MYVTCARGAYYFESPCITDRLAAADTIRLSSVLVSHFLLDLQESHQRSLSAIDLGNNDSLHTSQSSSNRSINFRQALGSLGATIGPGEESSENVDDRLPSFDSIPQDDDGAGDSSLGIPIGHEFPITHEGGDETTLRV